MFFENAFFIIGTSYAGKSTMVKEMAKRHDGIASEENYHDNYPGELLNSGFNVIHRDESRTIEQTAVLAEKAFGL